MLERIKPSTPTQPCYPRIEKARQRLLGARPFVNLENARIMTESFVETEGQPYVIRKTKAFREQCRQKTIRIWDDELIVGQAGNTIRYGLLCPDSCWSIVERELDNLSTRKQDPFEISAEDKAVLFEVIKPYWRGKSVLETWQARRPQDVHELTQALSIYVNRKTVRGPGELTAGYDWLVACGINGIRTAIEGQLEALDSTKPDTHARETYLSSLLFVCEGIVALSGRYARMAMEMADNETDPQRKQELQRIAEVCAWVPANPARNFQEALQSVWLYHTCILMDQNAASYNLGRVDQYLYPLYAKSVQAGDITRDQAQELLDCLWVKMAEPCLFQDEANAQTSAGYPMFQNTCCGGIDENGQDAVNELSYMVLQATMDVRLYQPSLSVRYNAGKNPDTFLRKVVELISLGTGFPAFHNDEVGIKMMMDKGVPLPEANNWNPCGCVETNLMGKMKGITDIAELNLGSAVETTLLNGVHRQSGARLFPALGDPRSFETFEAFKSALKQYMVHAIQKIVAATHIIDAITGEMKPVPVASLTHKECIQNAKDYEWGGAKYNTGNGIVLIGVADLINSLAAINKLLFEDKELTWDQLLIALDNDFEGYENVRTACLAAPKWGNDIDAVDGMATEMFQFLAHEVRQYHGLHGRMTCGILPVTAEVPMGGAVGALPSGRKAWTPLADGISPSPGTDLNGPTAVLKSVSKIPHPLYTSGTLLNMKLDPGLIEDGRGKRNLMGFLRAFCDLGIHHIQFNVIDSDTLIAAQKDPEAHRDLLVRVSGYTAYFTELGREIQDEIISRTTQTDQFS